MADKFVVSCPKCDEEIDITGIVTAEAKKLVDAGEITVKVDPQTGWIDRDDVD